MTPLHFAAKSGHIKIVNYLCDEGADINIQDNDGVILNAGWLAELATFEGKPPLLFEKKNSLSAFKLQRS